MSKYLQTVKRWFHHYKHSKDRQQVALVNIKFERRVKNVDKLKPYFQNKVVLVSIASYIVEAVAFAVVFYLMDKLGLGVIKTALIIALIAGGIDWFNHKVLSNEDFYLIKVDITKKGDKDA